MNRAELDRLLEAARQASKQDRISLRDPIADAGATAIPAMQEWIRDPEFGAFAVRVLEKVAERPDDRPAAIAALESVDPAAASSPVSRDIADVLLRLGHRRAATRKKVAVAQDPPSQWSGYEAAELLQQKFHDDMLDIFTLAGEATRKEGPGGSPVRGYWATYFLRAVRKLGGLAYAHQLLRAKSTSAGFDRLTEEGRLDLSMEALVLRPEYVSLFSEPERQVAASRLARAGYQRPPS